MSIFVILNANYLYIGAWKDIAVRQFVPVWRYPETQETRKGGGNFFYFYFLLEHTIYFK